MITENLDKRLHINIIVIKARLKKNIRITTLYKIINEIANVPNKEILIPADLRTRSNMDNKFA